MNDTTRDELVTEVIDIYAEPENFPREDASEHAESILRLIDDAVAARDAEIRAALLHEDVIDTIHSQLLYFGTTEHGVKLAVGYALGMIGLGDGTGGQG